MTVTSTAGINFFANIAAGPPAPLHPIITNFSLFFTIASLDQIKFLSVIHDGLVKSQEPTVFVTPAKAGI